MARILITGGAGFIGSRTAQTLLAKGHRVRLLDALDPQIHGPARRWPRTLDPRAEKQRGDVRDRRDLARALKSIDAVYHFAARTGTGQSQYDVADYVNTNVGGTAALLDALIRLKKRPRLILASSRAVYGEGAADCPSHGHIAPPLRRRADLARGRLAVYCPTCGREGHPALTPETHRPDPGSVYAWTKKHQEDLCRETARAHGLSLVILRYFNVYGAGQSLRNPYTGVATVFFNRLRAGQSLDLYESGKPTRDFVHVSDVAAANAAALRPHVPSGAVFNVGSGQATSIRELGETLGRILGVPARFEDRGDFRVGDILACTADLKRTRRVLGYKPRVSLEQGMKKFAAWASHERAPAGPTYEKTLRELKHFNLMGRSVSRGRS